MFLFEFIENKYFTLLFSVLFINIIILYFKKNISKYLKIIDYPDDPRKIHKKETPLIGGICFYTFLIPSLLFYFEGNLFASQFSIIFILLSIFFFTGLIDDIKPLKPKIRTIIIIVSLLIFLPFEQNLLIKKLHFVSTSRELELGYFSIVFTTFCIFALYNAINFADGVNGSVISISIFWLAILFIKNPNLIYLNMIIIMLILFIFNIKGKLFLGNSGTSVISIFFSLFIISDYNSLNVIFADEIIFLLFFPGMDMIRVTIERILKKRKIYNADKSHFHHYLFMSNIKMIWLVVLLLSISPYLVFLTSDKIIITLIISTGAYFILLLLLKKCSNINPIK